MNERIIEYIRKNLKAGYSKEAITRALLKAGYDISLVEEQMRYVLGSRPEKHLISDIKHELGSNSERYFIIGLIAVFVILVSVMGLNYFFDFNVKEKEVSSVKIAQDYDASLELFNRALIKNDETICDKIGDGNLRNECKSSFMHNVPVCDEQCQDKKILNSAIIHNNESLCMDIINESIRQDCSNAFYKDTEKAEEECGQNCLDGRLLNLALIRNNESVCLEINNTLVKNQCGDMFKKEVGEK